MTSLKASLPPSLRTDRLIMELFDYSISHYTCLLSAMNSPTAHMNMGDFGIRTPSEFDELNRRTRLSPSTITRRVIDIDTDIYYLLRLGGEDAPLMGAVSLTQRGKAVPPDVGWCILEPFMGRGYAAEAGKSLLEMAKEYLGVEQIITWPGAGNKRSLRVAEKIGFVFGGEVRDSDGGLNAVYILPGMTFDPKMSLSVWGDEEAPRK